MFPCIKINYVYVEKSWGKRNFCKSSENNEWAGPATLKKFAMKLHYASFLAFWLVEKIEQPIRMIKTPVLSFVHNGTFTYLCCH